MKKFIEYYRNWLGVILITVIVLYYVSNNVKTINDYSLSSPILINKSYKAILLGKSIKSSYITVVATYFEFKKSKHSHDIYKKWLKNLLISVHLPLVIYTDEKSKDFIYEERLATFYQTKIIVYNSIWDIMNELETSRNKSYKEIYKTKQNSKNSNIKYKTKSFLK
jgi:hypothetical protein